MNLVDSSGWLEYFANGNNAEFFSEAIENTDDLIVSTINIYEVFKQILIQRTEDDAIQAIALMQQGKVIDINSTISLNAAKLSHDLKLPMADSLIYITAQTRNATVWTQDLDFINLPGVKYISKNQD